MDVFSIAVGAFGVGAAYFIYLTATKGLPAAVAFVKAKWNAGKADLAALQGLADKVASLEQGAIAEVKTRLAAVEQKLTQAPALAAPAAAAPAPAAASVGAA